MLHSVEEHVKSIYNREDFQPLCAGVCAILVMRIKGRQISNIGENVISGSTLCIKEPTLSNSYISDV